MLCYVCTLSAIVIGVDGIAPGWFLWPTYLRSFPWSQLCKISENARWGCPCQLCHSSAFRAVWEPRFPAKCCAMFVLEVHCNGKMMAFAPGCFLWPNFWRSFPWSQLCKMSENAPRGCPCQICHSSALRALWEPRFAAKCCAMFAL